MLGITAAISLLAVVSGVLSPSLSVASKACSESDILYETCLDDRLDIRERRTPEVDQPPMVAPPGDGPVVPGLGAAPPALSPEELQRQRELLAWMRERCEDGIAQQKPGVIVAHCDRVPELPDVEADPSVPPRAPVTVEDLASFTPDPGELVAEPDGWAAVGTPANFYATSTMHAQNGDLFGALVTVRWVPVRYSFDYGDGHTTVTDTAGREWRDGEEWTETVSSHAFESRDDVTVKVLTEFAADVNAGGDWVRVPGTLWTEAPSQFIKVFEVRTVLTAEDCLEQPDAPGCR